MLRNVFLNRFLYTFPDHYSELWFFNQLKVIVEQFLVLAAASAQFESHVRESRELLALAASDADNMGPRTIAQVRRDRQKALLSAQAAAALSSEQEIAAGRVRADEGMTDSEDLYFSTVPLESAPSGVPTSPALADESVGEDASASNMPQCAQDIADREARELGVSVAFVWLCRWQGKVRWGLESVPHVPFRRQSSPNLTGPGSSKRPSTTSTLAMGAIDRISVSIDYSQRIIVPAEKGQVYVPVVARIRSLDDRSCFIGADALPFKGVGSSNSSSSGSGSSGSSSGLLWVGSVRYTDVHLDPRGEVSLPFLLLVTSPGVHDLNRFAFSALYAKDRATPKSAIKWKRLDGQCLLQAEFQSVIT